MSRSILSQALNQQQQQCLGLVTGGWPKSQPFFHPSVQQFLPVALQHAPYCVMEQLLRLTLVFKFFGFLPSTSSRSNNEIFERIFCSRNHHTICPQESLQCEYFILSVVRHMGQRPHPAASAVPTEPEPGRGIEDVQHRVLVWTFLKPPGRHLEVPGVSKKGGIEDFMHCLVPNAAYMTLHTARFYLGTLFSFSLDMGHEPHPCMITPPRGGSIPMFVQC